MPLKTNLQRVRGKVIVTEIVPAARLLPYTILLWVLTRPTPSIMPEPSTAQHWLKLTLLLHVLLQPVLQFVVLPTMCQALGCLPSQNSQGRCTEHKAFGAGTEVRRGRWGWGHGGRSSQLCQSRLDTATCEDEQVSARAPWVAGTAHAQGHGGDSKHGALREKHKFLGTGNKGLGWEVAGDEAEKKSKALS